MVQDWKTLVRVLSQPCVRTYGYTVVHLSQHDAVPKLFVSDHIDNWVHDKDILFSKVV